ncbi:MAG: hypothetical protein PF518_04135 [Spirochaetaceae bacterium]|jgi:hypothetical protein|nr:hypothetical protein [Spirochaetaceae bacterium]
MNKKLNRKLYIIPAIYIVITAFFYYQHFSQKIIFSQAIGNIELTGQSTKGTAVKPSEIKKLNMYVNGMSFSFSSKRNLEVKTEDNIFHTSKLLDYSSNEDNITLHFENDINLIFKTDFADKKVSISAILPETVPPITELSLPFSEERGFSLGYTEEDNTPVISNGETNFFIALTNDYKLDNDHNIITINVSDSTPITFMIQETLVGKGRTAEKWYEQNNSKNNTEYNEIVSNFINSAFFGWNSRFNSKTGMWNDANGVQQFNEITATAYLSESLIRGSYRTSASLIRTASVNREDELTAQTASYLGNIVVEGKAFVSDQAKRKNKIISLIQNKDRNLFKEKDLIQFMKSNKLEKLISDVVNLAITNSESDSILDILYRLNILNDGFYQSTDIELNPIMVDLIENNILPAVTWLDEGLFLEEDGIITVEQSIKAGILLMNSGNLLSNDFYKSVGKEMITSLLTRAKESAFLPENIFSEENRIISESGSLLPEDFYYDLTNNPYYQKQHDLTETLGSGSWILTSAKDYDIQSDGRETIITVNFPKGSIHHFAIKGIKPFTRIYMHDMKWNSDPNFQRYSDGWVYDKTNEILYVKMKHRVDNEEIKILYYYPETFTSESTTTGTNVEASTEP